MASPVEPAELERRAAAVRITRLLLPLYGALVLGLFGPGVLRLTAHVELLPQPWSALVADASLLGLIGVLVAWFMQMSSLGQWRPGGGPRFSLLVALLEGRWEATEPESPAERALRTLASASPLGVLAADVADVVARLGEAGHGGLAGSVSAAMREAEGVAGALARTGEEEAAKVARGAVGRFEDHVQQLRRGVSAVTAEGATTWMTSFEADLVDLRAAADALRRSP